MAVKQEMLRNKLHVYGDETTTVPSHLHFGKAILDKMVEYGEQPALINADDGESVTFSQLAQKAVDVALSLARKGVGHGDVVSICSERRMEVIPTILGVFCAGATYAPIDVTFGPVLVTHRLKITNPKVMFMSPNAYELHKPTFDSYGCVETFVVFGTENKDGCDLFQDFLTETADVADFTPVPVDGWKDFVWFLFSSGTTGMPKGIPWTHLGTLLNTISCTNQSFERSSILITREWYNSYGLSVSISCLKKGTTCVFSPKNEAEDFLRAIEKYKVKILQLVPSSINQLIKSRTLEQHDVSSVEIIMSASTPASKEQVLAVKKRFPNLRGVYQLYGMSEAGSVCCELHAPLGPKDGSVGTPSHGFILKVADLETREPLGPHQRGEICLKSPSLTPGYIGVENKIQLDSEGFYMTGDVGYYDEDRYFYIVNRIKELIKYNDLGVAPAELEAILVMEPRVADAGVGAVGGQLAALVVLEPDAKVTAQEILDYLHSNISFRVRLEGGVHLVESLPRGVARDKLDRKALQAMLERALDKDSTKQ